MPQYQLSAPRSFRELAVKVGNTETNIVIEAGPGGSCPFRPKRGFLMSRA